MALESGRSRFPYILFDLGSTLIYFTGDWPSATADSLAVAIGCLRNLGYNLDAHVFPQAYSALIREYSHRRNDTFLEYTATHVLREALREHNYPNPPEEHLRLTLKETYAVTQAFWVPEADAVPTLETLRAQGYRMGIVSNASDDADVQVLVDQAMLRPYFDFILTSAAAGVRKPTPSIFEQALAFWNARPDQAVMIGDTVSADVAGANRLGIASVWITRRNDTPQNRANAQITPPGATIFALSELPSVLDTWPG